MGATFETRAEILKQHILADYLPFRSQNPDGRILFKLGDNHPVKGFNEMLESVARIPPCLQAEDIAGT